MSDVRTLDLRAPLLAALLGLAGSLATTSALYAAGRRALDRVLDERLGAAGQAAALLLGGSDATSPRLGEHLRELRDSNELDGAFVLDRKLTVVADAAGPGGRRVDLLRVDEARLSEAFSGRSTITPSYLVGDVPVTAGYFPIRDAEGAFGRVLVLEAGAAFGAARASLRWALVAGLALSLSTAFALALVAARGRRAEKARAEALAAAARGMSMIEVSAMAAHEIRNPLGVIRGTVELMRERAAKALTDRDRSDLQDVLDEVERLRRLTEDFLDLARDRPFAMVEVELGDVLDEAARGAEASFPEVKVSRTLPAPLAVAGDPGRLRQVFANLLGNAAEAEQRGEVVVSATQEHGEIRVSIADHGPGVPADARARLFEPFFTTRPGGRGLGLAIARRLIERHGGSLELAETQEPGATFVVTLPAAPRASKQE